MWNRRRGDTFHSRRVVLPEKMWKPETLQLQERPSQSIPMQPGRHVHEDAQAVRTEPEEMTRHAWELKSQIHGDTSRALLFSKREGLLFLPARLTPRTVRVRLGSERRRQSLRLFPVRPGGKSGGRGTLACQLRSRAIWLTPVVSSSADRRNEGGRRLACLTPILSSLRHPTSNVTKRSSLTRRTEGTQSSKSVLNGEADHGWQPYVVELECLGQICM